MPRSLTVAAAQMGPISRSEPRTSVVRRMIDMMRQAKSRGAEIVVFPELALTTFFPRWFFEDQAAIDSYFEHEMPNEETQPLFEAACELGIGFYLGYAELAGDDGRLHHYNTAILVDSSGTIIGKYRKVHLPGYTENETWRPFQHLEKRYFETGNLGFPVFDAFGGQMGMGAVNLTICRRKEVVVAAFKRQPLHAILPWRQIELREAFGGR